MAQLLPCQTRIWLAVLLTVFCCAWKCSARDLLDSPYSPEAMSHDISNFAVGFVGQRLSYEYNEDVLEKLYKGPGLYTRQMVPHKGTLTEALMNDFLVDSGGKSLGKAKWMSATGTTKSQGLDGVFLKLNARGEIRDLLVGEAKYNTSRQGHTKEGPQMSQTWIKSRLAEGTGKVYSDLAYEVSNKGITRVNEQPKSIPRGAIKVPLNDRHTALVWREKGEVYFYSADESASAAKIQLQAQRISEFCSKIASSELVIKGRYFRYRFEGNEHIFEMRGADPLTGKELKLDGSKPIRGTFDRLPKHIQNSLRTRFQQLFQSLGMSKEEAAQLAEKCCKEPSYFSKMNARSNWSWKTGLDISSAKVALVGGSLVAVFDVLQQGILSGEVDLRQTAVMASLGLAGGAMSAYSSAQISAWIHTTELGSRLQECLPFLKGTTGPRIVSSGIGGPVLTAVLAYGMYFTGYVDLRTANRTMIAGTIGAVAGAGAQAGFFLAAATWGTASTGTAIGSLSGAAFTNAALAWLGGGSVAAGGYGAAVGSAILTGGVTLVVIGVGASVSYLFYLNDEDNRVELLKGRLQIVNDLVSSGRQREWIM